MLRIEHAKKKGKGGKMVLDYGFVIIRDDGVIDGVTCSTQMGGKFISREDAQVAIMRMGGRNG